jgi:hypothetical protein
MKKIKSPQLVGTKRANKIYQRTNSIKTTPRRKFDASLLPSPLEYYGREFPNLKTEPRWVQVSCCFHDDKTPSLSINLIEGHFRCFACGAKGGDIIAFHKMRYGMSFIQAVTDLGAWSYA